MEESGGWGKVRNATDGRGQACQGPAVKHRIVRAGFVQAGNGAEWSGGTGNVGHDLAAQGETWRGMAGIGEVRR